MVSAGYRNLLSRAFGTVLALCLLSFAVACDPANNDVATVVITNDTSLAVHVAHCASNCKDLTDKSTVKSGATYESNIDSYKGSEFFVVESTTDPKKYLCIHATYSGDGGAKVHVNVSNGTSVPDAASCG
jgi:hypothetical protein